MPAFVLRKLGAALLVVFVASVVAFAAIRAVPGDAATVLAGDDPTAIPYYRHLYGLDRPLPVQYVKWAWQALNGNLGLTHSHIPVSTLIGQRIPCTLELATLSLLFAILFGVSAGALAAVKRGKPADYGTTGVAVLLHSVPGFWLGLLLIILFAVDLHWLPSEGYSPMSHPVENLRHMVLPVIVLGTGFAASLMRQTRSSMISALDADYIRMARAKGLRERRIVLGHALRNSLITVATLVALDFGALLSGAAIVESVFGLTGFGRLSVDAVNSRDYAVVQATVLVTALIYVGVNLLADVLYSVLDPRIRLRSS